MLAQPAAVARIHASSTRPAHDGVRRIRHLAMLDVLEACPISCGIASQQMRPWADVEIYRTPVHPSGCASQIPGRPGKTLLDIM
jgi:hypothetical protein